MKESFELSLFNRHGTSLPLVVSPKGSTSLSELVRNIERVRPELDRRLLEHGGLLFRGFPISGAEEFAKVIAALTTGKPVQYIGGDSPRKKITGAVYTSTEAPSDFKIPLHNELSFVDKYPRRIFFHCEVAPTEGGETILGDARRVYQALDQSVRARLIERKLKYVSCYFDKSRMMEVIQPSHKSWRQVFETDDPGRVEELCREHGFDYEWTRDGWIRISQIRPAAITHPETGEWAWFSQPHLYDFSPRLLGWGRWLGASLFYARPYTRLHEVFHADGAPIARQDLYRLMATLDRCTISFPWRHGDVLMLDNVLAMHGRAPFKGPRRILAALTN